MVESDVMQLIRRCGSTSVCLLGILCFVPSTVDGAESVEDEAKRLIAQLPSPNKAPLEDRFLDLPVGYDRRAQQKVIDAWQRLWDLGPAVFPYVLDHLDDKRYCFTKDFGSGPSNLTVGGACHELLFRSVEPFDGWIKQSASDTRDPRSVKPSRPRYALHHKLRDSKSAKEWWEARKDMSLREIQLESIQFVIDEEAKRADEYADEEHRYMSELLKKLKSSDKALETSVPFEFVGSQKRRAR